MTDHEILLKILDELQEVKHEQQSMKIILENDTNKKINLLLEAHQPLVEKAERTKEIDSVKERLSDLERAVKVHTAQIAELKKAE